MPFDFMICLCSSSDCIFCFARSLVRFEIGSKITLVNFINKRTSVLETDTVSLCQSGLLSHDEKVVGSNLVSSKILDGNGVKAMSGSITARIGRFYKYKICFIIPTAN